MEWPLLMDVTTDFIYCRLHGSQQLYSSGYEEEAIETWSHRVVAWAKGGQSPTGRFAAAAPRTQPLAQDVFVYFDNDIKVRAPFDALALIKRVEELDLGAG